MHRSQKGINFAVTKGGNESRPALKGRLNKKDDSVAQLVEQMTLNHWVVGSSPTGVTYQNSKLLIFSNLEFYFYEIVLILSS